MNMVHHVAAAWQYLLKLFTNKMMVAGYQSYPLFTLLNFLWIVWGYKSYIQVSKEHDIQNSLMKNGKGKKTCYNNCPAMPVHECGRDCMTG